MTAQIDDVFRYRGQEYAVAGISEGELFEPSLLDLEPVGHCSACWRGYQAGFALSASRLVLDTLHVSLDAQPGPEVNGVRPAGPNGQHDWFDNHYEGLNYHLEYTGGVLLADGFIDELYVHMGFHPAWKYQTVFELVFAGGVLKQESDRSAQVAEARERVKALQEAEDSDQPPTGEDIARFVERAFDRSYRM